VKSPGTGCCAVALFKPVCCAIPGLKGGGGSSGGGGGDGGILYRIVSIVGRMEDTEILFSLDLILYRYWIILPKLRYKVSDHSVKRKEGSVGVI